MVHSQYELFMHVCIHKYILKLDLVLSFDNTKNPIYQPLRSGRIWHKVSF